MAKENDEPLEDTVAAAVTEAVASVADNVGDEKVKEEKLDAQAELFVRKISDSVTKAIAELLNPSCKPLAADEEDEEDAPKKPKRKAPKPPPAPVKKRSSFLTFLG